MRVRAGGGAGKLRPGHLGLLPIKPTVTCPPQALTDNVSLLWRALGTQRGSADP